jgi:hypothetical protein
VGRNANSKKTTRAQEPQQFNNKPEEQSTNTMAKAKGSTNGQGNSNIV